MKPIAFVAIILGLGLAACSTPEEPPAAPEPIAKPAAAPPAAGAARNDPAAVFRASTRAYGAAEKACRGCANPKACEEALTVALQLTAVALKNSTDGDDNLAEREKQATVLAEQFDGLAELSNECVEAAGG